MRFKLALIAVATLSNAAMAQDSRQQARTIAGDAVATAVPLTSFECKP